MKPKSKKALIIVIILSLITIIFLAFISASFFLYKLYLANKDDIDGIINDYNDETKITLKLSDSMGTFKNDKEFDKYLEEIKKNQEETDKKKSTSKALH